MRHLCRERVGRLEFLCVSALLYADSCEPIVDVPSNLAVVKIPASSVALITGSRRVPMIDLALYAGFVLLCLFVAYERLTHRL